MQESEFREDEGPWSVEMLHDFMRVQVLEKKEISLVFDVENNSIDWCAKRFAEDNGIPIEQLDRVVFDELVSLRTVDDVLESPLFFNSAKQALSKSLLKAFEGNQVRKFSTQGIKRALVKPTMEELELGYSRINVEGMHRDCPWKKMGDHPFFSKYVSCKFLQFFVWPNGQLRFMCDLLMDMDDDTFKQIEAVKVAIGTYQLRKEDAVRERLRRKLEKKNRAKEMAAERALTAPTTTPLATPTTHDGDQPFMSEEDKAKLQRRKERAAAERALRNENTAQYSEASPQPCPKTRKKHKKRSSRAVSDQQIGRKAESIEKCQQHTEWLRQREKERVAEIEYRVEMCKIGDAIQRGE